MRPSSALSLLLLASTTTCNESFSPSWLRPLRRLPFLKNDARIRVVVAATTGGESQGEESKEEGEKRNPSPHPPDAPPPEVLLEEKNIFFAELMPDMGQPKNLTSADLDAMALDSNQEITNAAKQFIDEVIVRLHFPGARNIFGLFV